MLVISSRVGPQHAVLLVLGWLLILFNDCASVRLDVLKLFCSKSSALNCYSWVCELPLSPAWGVDRDT